MGECSTPLYPALSGGKKSGIGVPSYQEVLDVGNRGVFAGVFPPLLPGEGWLLFMGTDLIPCLSSPYGGVSIRSPVTPPPFITVIG